jgi:hypothetical protein
MILVVIDEPKGQVYGGVVAAPAFNQIAVKTAYYLGIPPTEPVARAVARKGKEAQRPGGVPLTRVSTSPAESAMVMPDLRGLSMGRAVDVMGRHSVKLNLVGTGVARQQIPARPGKPICSSPCAGSERTATRSLRRRSGRAPPLRWSNGRSPPRRFRPSGLPPPTPSFRRLRRIFTGTRPRVSRWWG